MNLSYLETFVWLSRLRNFSRTAEKLHTSQPAVSSRMGKLEETLGVELYRRQTRDFELTPSGAIVLDYAEQISDVWAEMKRRLPRNAEAVTEIKIGVVEMAVLSWLGVFLDRVQAEFPDLKITVFGRAHDVLLADLQASTLDLAFLIGPINAPDVTKSSICSFSLEWYANPDMFPCDKEIELADLSHLPIISYSAGYSLDDFIRQYFEANGVTPRNTRNKNMTFDHIHSVWTAIFAVRQGLGIMPLPAFILQNIPEGGQDGGAPCGRLARLPVRESIPTLTIAACSRDADTNPLLAGLVRRARAAASEFALTQNPDTFWI
jgi:DNA-binding transcriptional LysR family regulator